MVLNVYAKSWGSSKNVLGQKAGEGFAERGQYREQELNETRMSRPTTASLCLPAVRRNVIVTDGVIDPRNRSMPTENRLHMQKRNMRKC